MNYSTASSRRRRSERAAFFIAASAVVGLAFLTSCYPMNDRDFWLHLRTGQLIWDTRALPRADLYSYTAAGREWVYPSWLAAVLLFAAYRAGGVAGAQIAFAFVHAAALAVLLAWLRRRGVRPFPAAAAGLLLALVLALRSAPRPYVFTHLMLAAFVCALASPRAPVLWLAPLMALWANLHPAFVAGLLLLAVHGLAAWGRARRAGEPPPWKFVACLGVIAAASLVNGYGWRAVWLPFRFLQAGPTLRSVSEWKPLRWEPALAPFFLMAAAAAWSAAAAWRRGWRPPLALALPALAFLALACTAVRHVALSAIAMTPLLAFSLDAARRGGRWTSPRTQVAGALLVAAAAGGLAANALAQGCGRLGLQPYCHPVAGVEFALARGLRGRLFNEFGKGAYIIWRAWPTYRVFIDGRVSVYGPRLIEDWKTICWMRPGWRERLVHYRIDFLLADNRLNKQWYSLPDWRLVYWSDVSRILVKSASAYARLAEPGARLTCPDTFNAERLARLGRLDEALACLEAKARREPDCVSARIELVQGYLAAKRFADALPHCRRLYAFDASNPEWVLNLGRCLLETGALEEAMGYLRRAAWLNPHSVAALTALGECCLRLAARGEASARDRAAEAEKWFARALSIAPTNARAAAGLQQAQRLRPRP